MATRYVAPGRLAWIEECSIQLATLVARYESVGRRCQIVGPHGSGKTTLLENLIPLIADSILRIEVGDSCFKWDELLANLELGGMQAASRQIVWLTLRRGSPVMHTLKFLTRDRMFRGTIVLDGAEQIGWWRWKCLVRWTRRLRCGLIVTSHRAMGLSTLYETSISPKLAEFVVLQAFELAGRDHVLPEKPEIPWNKLLNKHHGNLRESLMEVYDLIQRSIESESQRLEDKTMTKVEQHVG